MAYYLDRNEIKMLRSDLEEKKQKLKKSDRIKEEGWVLIGSPVICISLVLWNIIIVIIISVAFGVVTIIYLYFLYGKFNPYKLKKERQELESKIRELEMKIARNKDRNIKENLSRTDFCKIAR